MKILSVIAVMILVTAATVLSQFYYAEKLTSRETIDSVVDAGLSSKMKEVCNEYNITKCSKLSDISDSFCEKYGQASLQCAAIKEGISNLTQQKKAIYEQPILSDMSLASINLSISQSLPITIVVIIACLLVVYWVNKSMRSVLKATAMALLMTGISCLAVWIVLKNVLSSVPLIAGMVSDMAAYEMTIGFASMLLAVLIFVVLKFTKAEPSKKTSRKK